MSHQHFRQGAGAAVYNQATQEVSSTQPASPVTTPAPTLPGRQLTKTHPCTWPGCPRFFACPHNVQQHIREKHTHEKPFKCEACAAENVETAFARQYGLNRHRAQVHGAGEKPSRVAARGRTYGSEPAAELTQPDFPFVVPDQGVEAGDEFAEMMGLLQEANNAEMDVSAGGDVEISDVQFDFGAGLPEPTTATATATSAHTNNAQDSWLFLCGDCDYAATTRKEVNMHMHPAHRVPNSRLCACSICTMLHSSSEVDAARQLSLLDQGGFQKIREDAGFSSLGENAGFATASATSAWQPAVNNDDAAADYTTTTAAAAATAAGTIDPALLNLFGPSGSAGASSEMPKGSGRWA